MDSAARDNAFDTLQKRFVSLGFVIVFATFAFTLLGSMAAGGDPYDRTWDEAATGLMLAFLGINAVVHTVLIGRAVSVGWAIVNALLLSPAWFFSQILVSFAIMIPADMIFGPTGAVGGMLGCAGVAFLFYCGFVAPARTLPAWPPAEPTAAELTAIEAEIDRDLADPEAALNARFAALEQPRD